MIVAFLIWDHLQSLVHIDSVQGLIACNFISNDCLSSIDLKGIDKVTMQVYVSRLCVSTSLNVCVSDYTLEWLSSVIFFMDFQVLLVKKTMIYSFIFCNPISATIGIVQLGYRYYRKNNRCCWWFTWYLSAGVTHGVVDLIIVFIYLLAQWREVEIR